MNGTESAADVSSCERRAVSRRRLIDRRRSCPAIWHRRVHLQSPASGPAVFEGSIAAMPSRDRRRRCPLYCRACHGSQLSRIQAIHAKRHPLSPSRYGAPHEIEMSSPSVRKFLFVQTGRSITAQLATQESEPQYLRFQRMKRSVSGLRLRKTVSSRRTGVSLR